MALTGADFKPVPQYTPYTMPAQTQTSGPEYRNRLHEEISELPAISEPQFSGPAYELNKPQCPINDQYPASQAPPGIASPIQLRHGTVHDPKVDMLLREWTTVYDKPSFVIEP